MTKRGMTFGRGGVTRRGLMKGAAGTAAALSLSSLAAPGVRAQQPIRIGYVTPQSGALAPFAAADSYVLSVMRNLLSGGLETASGTIPVEIVVRDSQSNPNRAGEVARSLIVDEGVNLMVVASTPETTNPVSTVCEQEEFPLISTMSPWQPWYVSRQTNPGDPNSWQPFQFTYHFFWGLEDVIATYTGMWDQVMTNKMVGGLFPNDSDGNAWGDPNTGVAPGFAADGYTTVDPGRYEDLSTDFTAQINAFKQNNCEIVTGVVLPPDFTTFWTQANQQGFRPPVATVAKAILFPSSVEALGRIGHNLSSEVWWTPDYPYTSELTGATGQDVASGYTQFTGQPWTQPIGFIYALFEVALDVLKRAADPTDLDAVTDAIASTDLQTIVGQINWGADNGQGLPDAVAANVSKTPLTGGQWRLQDDGSWQLFVVENAAGPDVPLSGEMELIA